MTRATAAAALPFAVALGLTAEWAALRRAPLELPASSADLRLAAADFTAGAVLLLAGGAVAGRRSGDRVGRLLLAAGVVWFLGTFASSGTTAYADFGAAFVTLHRGPLVQALLSAPEGRLRDHVDRAVVAAVYVVSAFPPLARTAEVLVLTAAAVSLAAARRLGQPATTVPAAALTALAVVLAASAAVAFGGHGPSASRAVLWGYDLVVAASVAGVAVDIRLRRWARSTVTQLVVDLGSGAALRERLARALGDPSVEIGYLVPGRSEYVDDTGAAVPVAARTTTPLAEVGVLVHDAPVDDPELLEGVAAAARIALANVRLQTEVRRQVAELVASRRRLVDAGDAQRRRIEDAIRLGPERALARGAELLASLPPAPHPASAVLAGARSELAQAREDLAAFAQGVHPRALADGGLAEALRALTRHARTPVELDVPDGRLPTPVEETAYFVCAEALANAGKHAHATRVAIRVDSRGDRICLTVEDDGVGGADRNGRGLHGLADRVDALGGRFDVRSEPGGGTRVVVEFPQR